MVDIQNYLGRTAEALKQAIEDAYQAGFRAGIEAVASAAQRELDSSSPRPQLDSTADITSPEPRPAPPVGERAPSGRARRGLVRQVLLESLRDWPGLSISDYEKIVCEAEPEISTKSVGNELRRGEGTLYVRDVPRGNRWFLKGKRIEAGIGSNQRPASFFDNTSQEGGDGHAATMPN